MALESDGSSITTVVTCEGDLLDPSFPKQLERVLGSLEDLLGGHLYVCKLEPWNSVRVTLSIPREAALRLRQLAREGSQQLRALGILSVQVEGDQVISLRLAGPERQEIVLQTVQQDEGASSSSANTDGGLSRLLSGEAQVPTNSVSSEKMQFRSPNVVCPSDSVVPKVPTPGGVSSSLSSSRMQSGPFPFTSMNQAIQSRENSSGTSTTFTPPPPYPGKHPPVTLSSPLLVNLLQNDGGTSKMAKMEAECTSATKIQANGSMVHPSTSASISSPATFPPKISTPKVPPPFPLKVPAAPGRTGTTIYSLPQNAPATHTLQNPHPKMVHSQSTVTVNNSLNSDASFKQLAHASVSIQRGNPSNASPNLLHSKVTLLPNSAVRQTTVLPLPNSTITKPSAVLQNSGELELSSQSIVANKLNVVPQSSINTNLQPSAVIPNSSTNSSLLQPKAPPASISTIEDSQSVPNCVKNPFRTSSPLSSFDQPLSNLMELTPTLTDLKESDLDQLLPSLERDIASSPPELPEVLTDTKDHRKFLINPLTGELELQSSSDSESEEPKNVFTGLPSPIATSDEDTGPANRFDMTDHSDSETARAVSSETCKNLKLKSTKSRDRGRDSPSLKPTEKIKLRLKLEKSEPVSSGYKVDVSFINTQPKKATSTNIMSGEELRVPPLHISLRGRNHAVINNKKKIKMNADGSISKPKIRKTQGEFKPKKIGESDLETDSSLSPLSKSSTDFVNSNLPLDHMKSSALDSKKIKKIKSVQEHREQNLLTGGHLVDRSKDYDQHVYSSHFKDKLKERRGSDSELTQSAKRFPENNGLISADKKRRLSQTDQFDESQPSVLGSTNTGTIPTLSPKLKKDKMKIKESSKGKEIDRSKSYAKNFADKLAKQVPLPTGEIDMGAKFKQRLLENPDKIHINRSYRTETVQKVEGSEIEHSMEKITELPPSLPNPIPHKDKPPEMDKCNDQKADLVEKQVGRSPNSGGQGEDSGIESMDALSEKSPNQAGQSPNGDISDPIKPKTQVPDILDIEAQLAKMEGLNGEDMNDNKQSGNTKLEQCCGLASSMQDKDKNAADLSRTELKNQLSQVDVNLGSMKEDDLEPLPVRVTPPLYTYSNSEKVRNSDSPSLSDSDSNSCSGILKSKSLLEQLLIEIPDNQAPSSPSPVTRSLRTRACSKLSSPELNSPVPQQQQQQQQHKHSKNAMTPGVTKRKRRESESSNNSLDDMRNKKPRKCSENAAELIKACMGVETVSPMKGTPSSLGSSGGSNREKKPSRILEESSDSDEPLIEVAGKVRKNNNNVGLNTPKAKMKSSLSVPSATKAGSINTRRSVRTTPALNTRSKGDKAQPDAEVLRRKTRSSVSEGEGKRRKEVK